MGVPALLPLPFVGPPTTQFAVDDWNARLGSVCGSFHTRAPAGVVRGSVSMQPVLGIDIASINVGPSQIVRSQQDANRDGSAYYFLIAQRASQVQVLHKNRSTLLQAGDLVLVDSSQQSDFIYADASGSGMSSQFSVHIPRQFLADSVAGQHIGEKIPAQSDLAQCVWQQLNALQQLSALLGVPQLQTDPFQALFLKAFTQIFSSHKHQDKFVKVVLSLLLDADEQSSAVDHFASMSFSSRRTFFRIFENRQISFGELLKYIRLLRFLKLCNGAGTDAAPRSISTMAYAAGFTDISNFNHLFKLNFGVTPGALFAKC
jgi:AraC family transcriptional activator of tynA and feaB